jgi:hypothetical protein
MHSSCKYLPIYFNTIIFEDIEVWDFKIFKILKVKGSTGAYVDQIPSLLTIIAAGVWKTKQKCLEGNNLIDPIILSLLPIENVIYKLIQSWGRLPPLPDVD